MATPARETADGERKSSIDTRGRQWQKLKDGVSLASPSATVGTIKKERRTAAFKLLLQCFAMQIRYGCESETCTTPSCFSCNKRSTTQPVRRPTRLTARDQAFVLASTDNPLSFLCPHPLRTGVDDEERVDTHQIKAYVEFLMTQGDATQDEDLVRDEPSQLEVHVSDGGGGGATVSGLRPHSVLGRGEGEGEREGEAKGEDAPSPPRPKGTRVKMDKGSLVQNVFNTSKMASFFSHQNARAVPDDGLTSASGLLVHTQLSRDVAMAIYAVLSKVPASERDRRQPIIAFIARTIRYNLASPTRLLEQWILPDKPMISVLGMDGKMSDQLVPLDMALDHLKCWLLWLPGAQDEIFDSLWHALDAVFVPPPEIAASTGKASVGYLTDEQAARIIFIACLALIASVTYSDPVTLTFLLARRRMGDSVPISVGYASAKTPSETARMRNKTVQQSDAFEYEPALRLAEKMVAALAARRSFWCALQSEEGRIPPFIVLFMAYMARQINCILPVDYVHKQTKPDMQQIRRLRQSAWSIVIEWFKTVFRVHWNGEHVLDRWKGAGAALEALKDISQLLGAGAHGWTPMDSNLVMPMLGAQLKPHKVIPDYLAWMEANPPGSDSHKNQRHILQYPLMFEPSRRTHYFRLMLYGQMHHEWQASRAVRELHDHFSWLITPGAAEYRCPDPQCNHAMCERLRFQARQAQRWNDVGYNIGQRFPSNFWNRELYLRNKLATAEAKFLILDIERQTVLQSAFDQLWGRELRELLKPLKVVMRMDGKDEDAADHGGVSQEFFRLVLTKAFDPEFGLFVVTEDQARKNWFQPLSSEPLQTYELLGLLFGMAVYNGITLPVNFPGAMYQVLCGRGPLEKFAILDAWPMLGKSFQQLTEWKEADGDVEEVFSRDFAFSFEANGVTYTIDMLEEDPNAIEWPRNPGDSPPERWTDDSRTLQPVTFSNRVAFTRKYTEWLVYHSVRPQLDAFIKGFRHIIPTSFTSFMTSPSLGFFVEGSRTIDIAQLRAATAYPTSAPIARTRPAYSDEYSPAHPTVQHFWSVVQKFDQARLQKLLTFVTASDRVPVQGYKAIGFSIEKHGAVELLPTSSTCFGKLFLPPYESEELLAKRVGIAIEEGTVGFGFM